MTGLSLAEQLAGARTPWPPTILETIRPELAAAVGDLLAVALLDGLDAGEHACRTGAPIDRVVLVQAARQVGDAFAARVAESFLAATWAAVNRHEGDT